MNKFAGLICASALALSAQTSKIPIENDQVKVVDVTVQPHQKTRLHEHKINRVMIYLQPGAQDINYQDGKKVKLTWKAAEAKWSPASGMHIAEITSNSPVRIIEIELKKPAPASKPAANALDPVKVDPKHYKVDFENDQVRVLKVKIGPHETAPMHAHKLNRVVLYVTDQDFDVTTKAGEKQHSQHKAGDVSWGTEVQHVEKNLSDHAVELYAVEIKN